MNFATTKYLIFIAVFFVIYWHLNKRRQNFFMLIASYFFYANWDWRFLSLIIISTLVDYICGPRIHGASSRRRRKTWLITSMAVNLGILGYFKYFNFFADSFVDLACVVGWSVSRTTIDIILPVGISFYTFQSLSYSIDIYRGELKPTRSFIDFAAFVAFFPQLVAGPIVRAREFMFQLGKKRVFHAEDLQIGLTRFLMGFFKKAFIADTLAVYLVDPVFANPAGYSTGFLWLAMLGYAIQIYADFSGYSSMAIGSARILGFVIPENFSFPYLALNFSDFWRRWHMTMSRFFRDYIYFALGGNRCEMRKILRNIGITTLISGLWHGAGWTFVMWGGLHGLCIATYQIWQQWKKSNISADRHFGPPILFALPAWLITQLSVCIAWILFRSGDFSSSWIYLRGLISSPGAKSVEVPFLAWVALVAFLMDHLYGYFMETRGNILQRVPTYVPAVLYAAMIVFLFHARPTDVNPFIYFQF